MELTRMTLVIISTMGAFAAGRVARTYQLANKFNPLNEEFRLRVAMMTGQVMRWMSTERALDRLGKPQAVVRTYSNLREKQSYPHRLEIRM
jgi:hypothetical protein